MLLAATKGYTISLALNKYNISMQINIIMNIISKSLFVNCVWLLPR
jgi:hypothetical protein